MIKVQVGDMLAVKNGILVHGCNCQSVMGSGIALLIRKKWPGVFQDYFQRANSSGLHLGDVIFSNVTEEAKANSSTLIIASALTQENFGRDKNVRYVDYDAITACFSRIRYQAEHLKLPVHIPLIGCGLANGKWEEVGPRIEAAIGPDVDVTLWVLKESENPYKT